MASETKSSTFKISIKQILLAILIIGICLVGYKLSTWFDFAREIKAETNSQALLERIEKVAKLVTVEGHFSEIYDYKDYYWYDLSPFRKKALIRVKAKVSMGIDFEKVEMSGDDQTKTIVIRNIPEVEILSIDHDSDYYDISEGSFNSFSEKDYNELQKNAKEYIRNVAMQSDLVESAEEQRDEILEMMRYYIEIAGWNLKLEKSIPEPVAN